MIESTIYCPKADAWATIVKAGRWYVVNCRNEKRSFRDELQALGWAERMLGRKAA